MRLPAFVVATALVIAMAPVRVAVAATDAGCPYHVQANDTLGSIAGSQLGDPARWDEIYQLNKSTIGPNPDLIQSDTVLLVPCGSATDSTSATAVPTAPGPQPSTAGKVTIAGAAADKIRHVFVILQENHTFDNYFGTFPGADGIPAGLQVPVNPADSGQGAVAPWLLTAPRTPDLDHGLASAIAAYDGGKMDGFVKAQLDRNLPGDYSLGYYDSSQLPQYWYLAHQYVLGDRFFSSALGGSLVNHQYWVAARSSGFGESIPAAGITMPTIFDRLEDANQSWRFYIKNYDPTITFHNQGVENSKASESAWVPLLTMPAFVDNPTRFAKIVDLSTLFNEDLPTDNVADVSYVVQGGTSEHPPGDVGNGQDSVVAIITSIMRSSIWDSSAIFVSWDDWGGWYDHVLPPKVDADGYGFRVPLLVISPYARTGYLFHQTADFTSILKFIERLHGLAPLTSRDEQANDLMEAFDFAQPPRQPHPPPPLGVLDLNRRGPTPTRLIEMYGAVAVGGLLIFAIAALPTLWWRRKLKRG
jgi:phospholipase C